MKIEKIQSIITPKTTGYTAAGAFGLAIASGMSKNKTFRKSHKTFGWIGVIATIAHIGLIEYYHYKYKH